MKWKISVAVFVGVAIIAFLFQSSIYRVELEHGVSLPGKVGIVEIRGDPLLWQLFSKERFAKAILELEKQPFRSFIEDLEGCINCDSLKSRLEVGDSFSIYAPGDDEITSVTIETIENDKVTFSLATVGT